MLLAFVTFFYWLSTQEFCSGTFFNLECYCSLWSLPYIYRFFSFFWALCICSEHTHLKLCMLFSRSIYLSFTYIFMFLTLIIALHPVFYLHSFYFYLQFPLEMIYFYFSDIQLSRKLFHLLSYTTSIFHLLSVLTIVSFCVTMVLLSWQDWNLLYTFHRFSSTISICL